MFELRRIVITEAPNGGSWFRRILQGVARYAATTPVWDVHVASGSVRRLREWRPDGVIGIIGQGEPLGPWQALKCPVVSVASLLEDRRIPNVTTDERAVGRLGAEHLVERGLKHFGFIGFTGNAVSPERWRGFEEVACRNGSCSLHISTHAVLGQVDRMERKLLEWIEALPKPAGVMGWQDRWAGLVVQGCRRLGLHVPDQVAVLGVDDDDVWCRLCNPPLTSVRLPSLQIGFRAAELLDQLIGDPRRRPAQATLRLPPEGLHARRSTDALAVDDPAIIQAVSFIRAHLHQRVNVADVVEAVSISRRVLETRFREILGRSPLEEIHRQQMNLAEQLLRNTDLPLKAIAPRTGHRDANHLIRAFMAARGASPTTFRRQMR